MTNSLSPRTFVSRDESACTRMLGVIHPTLCYIRHGGSHTQEQPASIIDIDRGGRFNAMLPLCADSHAVAPEANLRHLPEVLAIAFTSHLANERSA